MQSFSKVLGSRKKKKFEKKFLTLQINIQSLSAKWTTGLYFRSSPWLFQVCTVNYVACTRYLQTNIVIWKQTWCMFSYGCKCYNHIHQSQSYYAFDMWNMELTLIVIIPLPCLIILNLWHKYKELWCL